MVSKIWILDTSVYYFVKRKIKIVISSKFEIKKKDLWVSLSTHIHPEKWKPHLLNSLCLVLYTVENPIILFRDI